MTDVEDAAVALRAAGMHLFRCAAEMSPSRALRPDQRPLTPLQLVIVRRVAAGQTDDQIAEAVHLSADGVKNRLRTIYDKLGVRTRAAAVAVAYESGAIIPGYVDRMLPAPPRQLAPCGTPAAYARHRAHGETCSECRDAMRPAWREARRAGRKSA